MKTTPNNVLACLSLLLAAIPGARAQTHEVYTYDTIGRLTQVTYDNETSIRYGYDPNGNLLLRVVEQPGETFHVVSYSYDRGGTITGPLYQIVPRGADAEPVEALPDEYWTFAQWTDGLSSASRTDTDITRDIHMQAHFAALRAGEHRTPLWWLEEYHLKENGRTYEDAEMDDTSGNGWLNWEEFVLDTDPRDPNSTFRILGVETTPEFRIHFEPASTRRLYTLEYTDDLRSGEWRPVLPATRRAGRGGADHLTDPSQRPSRIYRIRIDIP